MKPDVTFNFRVNFSKIVREVAKDNHADLTDDQVHELAFAIKDGTIGRLEESCYRIMKQRGLI